MPNAALVTSSPIGGAPEVGAEAVQQEGPLHLLADAAGDHGHQQQREGAGRRAREGLERILAAPCAGPAAAGGATRSRRS